MLAVVTCAAMWFAVPETSVAKKKTGTVSGTVDVRKGAGKRADRKGVVVYIKGLRASAKSRDRAVVRQKDETFRPKVTVVVVGTTIDFPNDDRVAHNVFSPSDRFRDLDLGEYKAGSTASYTFRRTGEATLYCNIHPQMEATVKVVDNAFYAFTDSDGRFEITGVPAGTHEIAAWLPYSVEEVQDVVVKADKTSRVLLEIEVGEPPSHHLKKDGTPYGRGY